MKPYFVYDELHKPFSGCVLTLPDVVLNLSVHTSVYPVSSLESPHRYLLIVGVQQVSNQAIRTRNHIPYIERPRVPYF
jgi:hypothetical protein